MLRLGAVVSILALAACSSSSPAKTGGNDAADTRRDATAETGGKDAAGTPSTAKDANADQAGGAITCRPLSCPSGWFADNDTVCSPPATMGSSSCSQVGDGLCYLRCATDADCQAVGLSSCRSLTLFGGSDVGHATPVCAGTAQLPACAAADAAGD